MQLMTAKNARNHFGDLMNSMQREPIFITKNNKPVGAFVSIADLQGTHIMDEFLQDDRLETDNYQEFLHSKLSTSYAKLQKGSQGVDKEQARQMVREKLLASAK